MHPLASTGSLVELGDGTVVAAGARLTTGISVGRHGYLGPNASVGHDAYLEDYVTVLPGATISGHVHLGVGTSVGTGANIRQGVIIGEGATVGAGAVVLEDVPEGTVRGRGAGSAPSLGGRDQPQVDSQGEDPELPLGCLSRQSGPACRRSRGEI